jgi:hypothetical protein
MNGIATLTLMLAALSIGAVPASLAQTTTAEKPGAPVSGLESGAEVHREGNNPDANADGHVDEVEAANNCEDDIEGLASFSMAADQMAGIGKAADIRVVGVCKSTQSMAAEQVSSAFAANEAGIFELRQSLTGVSNVQSALDKSGVTIDDVVAAEIDETGLVILYVQNLDAEAQDMVTSTETPVDGGEVQSDAPAADAETRPIP